MGAGMFVMFCFFPGKPVPPLLDLGGIFYAGAGGRAR